MNHDAAHKYIHSLPEVTADLLRLVVPDLVGELDLPTLEDRSSSKTEKKSLFFKGLMNAYLK